MSDKKAIPEMSIDTRLLIEKMKSVKVGDVISYDELSKIIGRDIRSRQGYARLQSARRNCLKQHGIVFSTVAKEGLRRCDDSQIVGQAEHFVHRAHRISKRGIDTLACADFQKLDNTKRVELNAIASGLGVIHHITSMPAQKKLMAAAQQASDKLPLAKTLEVFKT